jgi:NAD(P)H-flavin reductase
VTTKVVSAEVTSLPGGVIRLSIPGSACIDHVAGQYVFIRIKEVNGTEYHPFSFSSSPSQDITTIHIRELGNSFNIAYV